MNDSVYNINETFIIEGDSNDIPIISACTAFYSNEFFSCTGDTFITLSTGVISFNGSLYTNDNLSANTINASTFFSGGTNLFNIIELVEITGGTYNRNSGVLTLAKPNNNAVIVSGISDYYTTGATLVGNIAYFNRNDSLSAYTLDLSTLTPPTLFDVFVTGGTYSNGTAVFTNNTGGTFSVSGFSSGISIISFSYDNANNLTIGDSSGGTFSTNIGIMSGLTVNGILSASTYENLPYWSGGTGLNSIVSKDSFNNANGDYSLAVGYYTTASGTSSHSEGQETTAIGVASHAEGVQTTAIGTYSHAEGYTTTASGTSSHAEGLTTIAEGDYSHAEGSGSYSLGESSHAEGGGTQALGVYSHAEGQGTIASTGASHAEGRNTISEGYASHAEGSGSVASGDISHAEGQETQAIGLASHASGYLTSAEGDYSFAGGIESSAVGVTSFVFGSGSTAELDNTIVFGANIKGDRADNTYVDGLNIKTLVKTVNLSLGIDKLGYVGAFALPTIEINTGTTSINFGSYTFEDTTAFVSVVDENVTTESIISFDFFNSTDHTKLDALYENIKLSVDNIVDGVGFEIYAFTESGTWGEYNIRYNIINF